MRIAVNLDNGGEVRKIKKPLENHLRVYAQDGLTFILDSQVDDNGHKSTKNAKLVLVVPTNRLFSIEILDES